MGVGRMVVVGAVVLGVLAGCSSPREPGTEAGSDVATAEPAPDLLGDVPIIGGRPFRTLDGRTVVVGGGGDLEDRRVPWSREVWRVDLSAGEAERLADLPIDAPVTGLTGATIDGRTVVVAQGCALPDPDRPPATGLPFACEGPRLPVAFIDQDGSGSGWEALSVPRSVLDGGATPPEMSTVEDLVGIGVHGSRLYVYAIGVLSSRILVVDVDDLAVEEVADVRLPGDDPRTPGVCVADDGTVVALRYTPHLEGEVGVAGLLDLVELDTEGRWEVVDRFEPPEYTLSAQLIGCPTPAAAQVAVVQATDPQVLSVYDATTGSSVGFDPVSVGARIVPVQRSTSFVVGGRLVEHREGTWHDAGVDVDLQRDDQVVMSPEGSLFIAGAGVGVRRVG